MSDPRDDKIGDVDEMRRHPIPDNPPPRLDPDETPTLTRHLVCTACDSKRMYEDAEGEQWVCPDCGASTPTVRGIIHEAKAIVERDATPPPGLDPQRRRHA